MVIGMYQKRLKLPFMENYIKFLHELWNICVSFLTNCSMMNVLNVNVMCLIHISESQRV